VILQEGRAKALGQRQDIQALNYRILHCGQTFLEDFCLFQKSHGECLTFFILAVTGLPDGLTRRAVWSLTIAALEVV
jgi:hypothetical protein